MSIETIHFPKELSSEVIVIDPKRFEENPEKAYKRLHYGECYNEWLELAFSKIPRGTPPNGRLFDAVGKVAEAETYARFLTEEVRKQVGISKAAENSQERAAALQAAQNASNCIKNALSALDAALEEFQTAAKA